MIENQLIQASSKPEMNIMLTSVGRRAYLVNYFKEALEGRGKVIATNSHPDAAGMLAADVACVVPKANEARFIESLLDICKRYSVKLLMSLHDWEAPFIAKASEKFREVGTILVISDNRITEICLDKWATFKFLRENGLNTPLSFVSLEAAKRTLEAGLLNFPVILKPRRGQGSLGIELAYDYYELEGHYKLLVAKLSRMESNGLIQKNGDETIIIQEYLSGVEYDLEVVNDLDGHYICVLGKKKLSSRAGECELAETVEEQRLTDLGRQIGSKLGHLGVLDVDILEQGGILYVLEFNPRFGGCYPFSHMAGANLPAAYLAWVQGMRPDPSWLRVRPGVKCFKDFAFVIG